MPVDHPDVPPVGHPDRQRVLNVLAQRRYRQKKKKRLETLEAVSLNSTSGTSSIPSELQISQTARGVVQPYTDPLEGPPAGVSSLSLAVNADQIFSPSTLWDFSDFYSNSNLEQPSDAVAVQEQVGTSATEAFIQQPTSICPLETGFGISPVRNSPNSPRYPFPDEKNLAAYDVTLRRGTMAIAKRLGVAEILWSHNAQSPFTQQPLSSMASYDHLPANLRPTRAQLSLPHHPLFDVLPWPVTRSKLIQTFALPPELRPPVAASPSAKFDLLYDIDDPAEGIKVWGDDPLSDSNWEIGEKLISKWWWAFDSEIVRNSNNWRIARGAPSLGSGCVVGEVA